MLGRLERAFERMVEGSIAGFFRLRVQPAEIGRRLERAMLDGRAASVGVTLAPNLYDVRLHPDDAATFAGWEDALSREMETWLAELAFARGLSTIGPIRVRIAADPGITRRSVRAEGRFASGGASVADRHNKNQPLSPLRLRPKSPGVPGMTLSIGPMTVGRADDNDLVLPDPEVSRR
ncbi:MAG: FhaA domain-containing protein, partial [Thermomicrobiales bacterium]